MAITADRKIAAKKVEKISKHKNLEIEITECGDKVLNNTSYNWGPWYPW